MSKLLKRTTLPATKLTTTFSLAKLHEVPAWGAPEVMRAVHSDDDISTSSSAASSVRVATIDRAEPCFITKVAAYTHEQVHMINPIRGNSENHQIYKKDVETFLERQGIVDPLFDLDHACNVANMDPSLHIAMDKYAMFAVTCSEKFLDKYIEIIKGENEIWAARSALGKRYVRDLQLVDPSVRIAEYELVVLQPNHFLPDSSILLFYERQDGKVSGSMACKIVDKVLRRYPWAIDSPRYPAFRAIRSNLSQNINPYLVILAAEIKFRRYIAANGPSLPPVYDAHMRKTLEVADLLYFQPVGLAHGSSSSFSFVPVDMESRYARANSVDSNIAALETSFWTGAEGESGGSTARQKQPAAGGSRTRRNDADYWRHMMSGRDLELNDDDLDLLREIEESNRAASNHSQSVEQVEM